MRRMMVDHDRHDLKGTVEGVQQLSGRGSAIQHDDTRDSFFGEKVQASGVRTEALRVPVRHHDHRILRPPRKDRSQRLDQDCLGGRPVNVEIAQDAHGSRPSERQNPFGGFLDAVRIANGLSAFQKGPAGNLPRPGHIQTTVRQRNAKSVRHLQRLRDPVAGLDVLGRLVRPGPAKPPQGTTSGAGVASAVMETALDPGIRERPLARGRTTRWHIETPCRETCFLDETLILIALLPRAHSDGVGELRTGAWDLCPNHDPFPREARRSRSAIRISPSGRIKGNRITSRIVGESVSSIVSRSMPMPSPAVGGSP